MIHLFTYEQKICNGLSPPPFLLWALLFGLFLKVYKTHLLRRGFHTLIKSVSFSSPTDVRSPSLGPSVLASTRSFLQSMLDPHQIHPLRGPASLLAHRLMSTPLWNSASSLTHRSMFGSDTICNGPSPLLVDIVLFGLYFSDFPTRFLKRVC